ncbi:MAG: YtxH domain-containing protein [Nitrospiraceae bacterium]|jgi:gas vesicle protein|nr:YtxH domain-containing protein [Nitrospirota bacterium]MDA8213726.1 YtxH domain-containing protein [Nitrospiraceae bacterium]MDA8339693.1 YtxH domain-containing protein [Nitrospiraceae bacterium]
MRHEEGGFSAGSVLLSFLLGGMVGAGLALLMAPQSGAETRRKIREFTDDVKEKASDYAGEAKEKITSTVEKGKHILDEKKSAITAAFEAGKEAYEKEVKK